MNNADMLVYDFYNFSFRITSPIFFYKREKHKMHIIILIIISNKKI